MQAIPLYLTGAISHISSHQMLCNQYKKHTIINKQIRVALIAGKIFEYQFTNLYIW